MKIVLAPDSFKGSLTAKQVCDALEEGIRRVLPSAYIVQVPMADGGEGTVQSLVDATGGRLCEREVCNPLGEPQLAQFGILGDGETAVIEIAAASGLVLIAAERQNPLITSTYGAGELIRYALELGCRKFIIGLGGSATNDGGMGMAQALGVKFLDKLGAELSPGGGSLGQLERIDLSAIDPRTSACSFTVACDVDNPLCGPTGASHMFGAQKGATPAMTETLDRNLAHYANIIEANLGIKVMNMSGAGAAGGLGAGLVAFFKAKLQPGIELIQKATGLEEKLYGADLVITGEGRCDFQTVHGKTPFGVAKAAQKQGIPVMIIAGSLGQGAEILFQHGVIGMNSIMDEALSVEEAIAKADIFLANAAERIMRLTIK